MSEVENALNSLELSKIKNAYIYPASGASSVDARSMTMSILTASGRKDVRLDTTLIDDLHSIFSYLFTFFSDRSFA